MSVSLAIICLAWCTPTTRLSCMLSYLLKRTVAVGCWIALAGCLGPLVASDFRPLIAIPLAVWASLAGFRSSELYGLLRAAVRWPLAAEGRLPPACPGAVVGEQLGAAAAPGSRP